MKLKFSTDRFSIGEEIANAITHGVGVIYSFVVLAILLFEALKYPSFEKTVSAIIFPAGLILTFTFSTLLHSFVFENKAKKVFEILDHSSIFLLILFTYTPFLLLKITYPKSLWIFLASLVISICGISFKVFYVNKFRALSTLGYVFQGWMIVFFLSDLLKALDKLELLFLILGGIIYSLGSIFYVFRLFKFHHMVWHILVLVASFFHFLCIYSIL